MVLDCARGSTAFIYLLAIRSGRRPDKSIDSCLGHRRRGRPLRIVRGYLGCKMRLGLINSAWEQHGIGLVRGLKLTRAMGFDFVDIFQDPLDPGADRRVATIRSTCRRLRLPIVSVVGVSLGLIDLNPSVRRFHLERSKRYLDMGRKLGARNYLLVLGEYLWQKEVIPPSVQWGWAVEACRKLGNHARRAGLEIVLELEPFKLSLLNNVDSMVRFLEEVNHPRVKANIDVSHM